MKEYRIVWEIDIEANSHKEAVKKARKIQLDLESIATCFKVAELQELHNYQFIDLGEK